ncbi:UNVERIFIED_ORG: hypothetical protein J2W19_003100 [Shinella zoogloeoides]|nr:hypothetical protein [Shinella zoogloeoides]
MHVEKPGGHSRNCLERRRRLGVSEVVSPHIRGYINACKLCLNGNRTGINARGIVFGNEPMFVFEMVSSPCPQ